MSRLNVQPRQPQAAPVYTHEGARAHAIGPEAELRRSVMSCLLWEDDFYESGESVVARIKRLIPLCRPEFVAAVAASARSEMKLRHVPLLVVREMARHPGHKALVSRLLPDVIQRPDEITEFLAIYHAGTKEKQPLSAQVKKGLAAAFQRFNAYQLAKYNRDGPWKLRDALFLSHAKPTVEQVTEAPPQITKRTYKDGTVSKVVRHTGLFKDLVEGTLQTPDTWEVALSGGGNKKDVFERLMLERKLGALAFLRNLRNMTQSGVDESIIKAYAEQLNVERVLPFRFLAAARAVPRFEPLLEPLMFKCLEKVEKLGGRTALLVDHSGSMQAAVSAKSEITRFDAAAALGILLREVCDECRVFTFSDKCIEVPARRGFALEDSITSVINPVGTLLGKAVNYVYNAFSECDRIVVITDEQSHDKPMAPRGTGYVINVGSARNGVGYGPWLHIDGWSEAVLDYIRAYEKQ